MLRIQRGLKILINYLQRIYPNSVVVRGYLLVKLSLLY